MPGEAAAWGRCAAVLQRAGRGEEKEEEGDTTTHEHTPRTHHTYTPRAHAPHTQDPDVTAPSTRYEAKRRIAATWENDAWG